MTLPAQWLNSYSVVTGRAGTLLEKSFHELSQPQRILQIRRVLIFLLALWAVLAISRLVWSLVPAGELQLDTDVVVINPINSQPAAASPDQVDIQRMTSWHLFGEAGGEPVETAVAEPEVAATNRVCLNVNRAQTGIFP